MTYQCPKGHQSADSDYCSECGALIGQSKISNTEPAPGLDLNKSTNDSGHSQDICPDCGTPRAFGAKFCEVCRHDFQDNKTVIAEAIVAEQQPVKSFDSSQQTADAAQEADKVSCKAAALPQTSEEVLKEDFVVSEKLNVIISVKVERVAAYVLETDIEPDSMDRIFPLDLDENLVGRRSAGKGIYPEIEINDPGVSRRHLKFIKQSDGSFAVLELGSTNGTELNGVLLEPGVNTTVKAGDELTIGIWTILKLVSR